MAKPLSRILVIEDEPLSLRSQKRTELHGIVHEGYQPCIRVLKTTEEKSLQRIG